MNTMDKEIRSVLIWLFAAIIVIFCAGFILSGASWGVPITLLLISIVLFIDFLRWKR